MCRRTSTGSDGFRCRSRCRRPSGRPPSVRPDWRELNGSDLFTNNSTAFPRLSTISPARRRKPCGSAEQRLQPIAVFLMSELVVAIMLIVTGFLFSLELRRRRIAETRLQETLASVEQQVADRTDALSKAMAELKISEQQQLHGCALDERAAAVERAEAARRSPKRRATSRMNSSRPPRMSCGRRSMRSSAGCTCSRPARSKDDEQRQQAVDAIDRNAKIQTRLIEDLLDVSRMIQGRVSLTVAPDRSPRRSSTPPSRRIRPAPPRKRSRLTSRERAMCCR